MYSMDDNSQSKNPSESLSLFMRYQGKMDILPGGCGMKAQRIIWGFALIGLGLFLILERMGFLPEGVSPWGIVIALLLIAFGVSWIISASGIRNAGAPRHVSIPKEHASSASIQLDYGAGELIVKGGAAADVLVEGDFLEGVEYSSRVENSTLKVNLKTPSMDWGIVPVWSIRQRRWELLLAQDIPMSLVFNNGANSSDLDLRQVLVQDLQINTGASNTQIRMPASAGHTNAFIKAGAASITVSIPENVAAQIHVVGAISTVNIDSVRFPRHGDVYRSPDYGAAENRLDLKLECGVGSIEIK